MNDEHFRDDVGRLREITQQGTFQQGLQLLPLVTYGSDRSMDLFRTLLFHDDRGQRDFNNIIEEFIQLIESKLADAQHQMFSSTYV
jgi:hypothetical protein